MGIIWYFEILAFLVGDGEEQSWGYFTITDCINMLQVYETYQKITDKQMFQGVWVFMTFVCKRNVIEVITLKRDRLYSAVLNRSKSGVKSPQ